MLILLNHQVYCAIYNRKCNQGNQDSSSYQNKIIHSKDLDYKGKIDTYNKEHLITKITHTKKQE